MLITNLQIRETKTDTRLSAVVSLTFDNMIVIHDIKIINNDGDCFLAMPSRKSPKGTFKDIAHPISKEARAALENIVLSAFKMMQASNAESLSLSLNPDCTATNLLDEQITDLQ